VEFWYHISWRSPELEPSKWDGSCEKLHDLGEARSELKAEACQEVDLRLHAESRKWCCGELLSDRFTSIAHGWASTFYTYLSVHSENYCPQRKPFSQELKWLRLSPDKCNFLIMLITEVRHFLKLCSLHLLIAKYTWFSYFHLLSPCFPRLYALSVISSIWALAAA